MKVSLLIWLSVDLLLAASMSASTCILRHGERKAFQAWRDAPTAETRAALDAERAITSRHRIVLAVVLFGGMAVVTVPIVRAAYRPRSLAGGSHTQNAA